MALGLGQRPGGRAPGLTREELGGGRMWNRCRENRKDGITISGRNGVSLEHAKDLGLGRLLGGYKGDSSFDS